MDCGEDSFCLSYTFPTFIPPPPLPSFLSEDVEAFLNQSRGHVSSSTATEATCDLCTWAGASSAHGEATGSPPLPLSSLLIVVAVVSALAGAGLSSFIIMIKRLRNRKFEGSDSVRHLNKRRDEPSRPSSSSFTSNALTENTYCEGPYNDKDVQSNNIYAELHTGGIPSGASSIWSRPPIPAPVQNCYLELKDIPNRCGRCLPAVPPTLGTPHWQSSEASQSSSYYSDLDLARHSAQPV